VTLEQAGFEIRDQIMWIYSSGFPKSQDIGRQLDKKEISNTWTGWGTSLKPAHEPIALARKPLDKNNSIARNCQQWGVGALNIDATRVPFESEDDKPSGGENGWSRVGFSEQPVEKYANQKKKKKSDTEIYLNNKRGPMERAKISDGENIGMFDGGVGYKAIKREVDPAVDLPEGGRFPSNVLGEIPDYQKYFYCPKVSSRERHIGMADVKSAPQTAKKGNGIQRVCETCGTPQMQAKDCLCDVKSWVMPTVNGGNNHPTVKPIELMKYLIKLITPPGGTVLDPFNGSGSTGCAAVELGHPYIGCELDEKYVAIAWHRIRAWYQHTNPTTYNQLFEKEQ
jgi:site-specific DNA-methyltransferase (adenine-specific)